MLIIAHNRKNIFLVLGEGTIDDVNDIVGTTNKKISIIFTKVLK